ncbi:MAG: serine/threonine-protein phosphatase [Clostridiales bacterium]|nr:serine/threonine-protein phosphatase [Clostridiales bacterium]
MTQSFFLDIATHSLNKYGEELCGDHVEIIKTDDHVIAVLADGLGSGVKANILATLTSKIMSTMLQKGADLIDTIDTITHTLPVCSVRKIGYSTFSIIEIDTKGHARIIEFDNPPVFVVRNQKILPLEKEKIRSADKDVWITSVKLEVGDEITLCSDGVVHAGVGNMLNHGWEWHHVAEFLQSQNLKSAEKLNRRLIETCQKLYDEKPGDDTTAVTIKLREPEWVHVFTGPPEIRAKDFQAVDQFIKQTGKKVVCGGTAANIVSRELGREIKTSMDYIDPFVPPTAEIKGIDLVTEGVLTLKMALTKLKHFNTIYEEPFFNKEDGVSKLLKILIDDSTHIQFWMGRAINPAHQNPDFPKDLSIKSRVIQETMDELKKLGKDVRLSYTD